MSSCSRPSGCARILPPHAATAAPTWWAAKTQPKTMPTLALPNERTVSATVGGTVATQSSPKNTANAIRPMCGDPNASGSASSDSPRRP